MNKSTAALLAAWVLGLAGGLLRLFELLYAFDHYSQLLTHWHWTTAALAALTLTGAALICWISRGAKPSERMRQSRPSPLPAAFLLAAALQAVLAVFDIRSLIDAFSLTLLMYFLLTLFSVAALVFVALGAGKKNRGISTGFCFTVVVFWCCFTLVLDFWGHAANPVLLSFLYSMFSLVFLTLGVYGVAGLFFGHVRNGRTLASSALGIYFTLVTLVSLALYPLLNKSEDVLQAAQATPQLLTRLLFILVLMTALAVSVGKGLFAPPPAAAPAGPDEAESAPSGEIEADASEPPDVDLPEA